MNIISNFHKTWFCLRIAAAAAFIAVMIFSAISTHAFPFEFELPTREIMEVHEKMEQEHHEKTRRDAYERSERGEDLSDRDKERAYEYVRDYIQ